MKRLAICIATAALFMINTPAKSQEYATGLGLRLGGYTSGLTIKHFVNSRGAIEGIAGFGRRSYVMTGLYEYHFPITGVNGLGLYAGGGGHVGFFGHESSYLVFRDKKNEHVYVIEEGKTAVIPGADFIFGVEYKFQGAPFTVGVDLKPFVDFYEGVSGYGDGAINVRYVF